MADKQKHDDKDDELIPVGPGAEESASESDEPAAGEEYTPYEEGEETGGEEERAGHAEDDDPEGGASREESPSAKRRRRLRERQAREQRELNFLRSRNETLEREHSRRMADMENRQNQSDIATFDGRISQSEADVREAEALLAEALEKKDTGAAIEALRVRDELRDGLNQLKFAKGQVQRQAQVRATQQPQAQAPQVDPVVSRRAQEWIREHTWFDPTGSDEDSVIAYAIEQRLYREGRLDPTSDEYWEEADRRIAKRLPHHYRDERDEDERDSDARPQQRNGNGGKRPAKGGPTFRTGGRERPLRQGEVYVDPERRKAMEEYGVWDDPVQRQKYLAQYQKYDREHGRRRH